MEGIGRRRLLVHSYSCQGPAVLRRPRLGGRCIPSTSERPHGARKAREGNIAACTVHLEGLQLQKLQHSSKKK